MTMWTLILAGLSAGWPVLYLMGLGMGYRAGRDRGRFDAEIAAAEGKLQARRVYREARQAPRHAQTQPRAGAGSPSPRTAPARPDRTSLVTTAADLAPVIFPQWGTQVPMRPQAAGAKHKAPTETGEMAAVTSEYIHKMRAEEAAYRKRLQGSPA